MKTICFLLFAITMVFVVSQAQGEEWVSINTNKQGNFFYNRESVAELPNGIIKVWLKGEFSDKGRSDFIEAACKFSTCVEGFDMLSYMLVLFEVNCSKKEQRAIASSFHTTDGHVLESGNFEGQPRLKWDSIPPESIEGRLYDAVCPPQEKKADLVPFVFSAGVLHSYDKGTIVFDRHLVKVWVKSDPLLPEAKTRIVHGKQDWGLPTDGYIMYLYEIDCHDRKMALIAASEHDDRGRMMYSGNADNAGGKQWEDISPYSMGDNLYNIVCDMAMEDYNKAIELNPRLVEAYTNRGNAYWYKQQYDKAIEDYNKAVELNPRNAIAYTNRGVAYKNKQQYERAIEDFNRAIELDPGYANAYYNRGLAYSAKQQYDRAIENYNRAIELNPKYVEAYGGRGTAYGKKHQYERAIEDFNRAIELNPRHANAYSNRGVAYMHKHQYDRAIEDYNKAIELNPKHARAYYNKACVYSLTNRAEEACKMLIQSIEKGYNDWKYIKSNKDFDNIRDSSCYKEIMSGR